MLSFMLGVLGSVTFWIFFLMIGFFIGSLLLKNLTPYLYQEFIEERLNSDEKFQLFFVAIAFFILWPITLIISFIVLLFKKVLWPVFIKLVKTSISLVPDIKIVKKEEN